MNRYTLTQVLSMISVGSAILWWWFFPDNDLNASQMVGYMLGILQAAIVPNAFLSLLVAILMLSMTQINHMVKCFVRMVLLLWGVVTSCLFAVWLLLSHGDFGQMILPTFNVDRLGVTIIIPSVMLLAIVLGGVISSVPRLRPMVEPIRRLQSVVSKIFESIFLLIPVLVFFVIVNFLSYAGQDLSAMAIQYFLLAVCFVLIMNIVILPLLYRYVLGVGFSQYSGLVAPVVLMTFLAGDSIAAVPLIARAATRSDTEEDLRVSRIITLVIICFPWLGELANLLFPVYSAVLEGFGMTSILSILSVGPFFMFTDPYISIPTLLSVFDFPQAYQVTYMTLALLTDHMFEVCESLAVLFVVIRLKQVLDASPRIEEGHA